MTFHPHDPSSDANRSDEDLIRAVKAGETKAFDELVNRYEPRLAQSMRARIGSHSLADDVTQEAFLKAFQKLSSFRGRCSFYTWLYRIALNSLRSMIRTASLKMEPLDGVEFLDDVCQTKDCPQDRLVQDERKEQIHVALNLLPENQRRVLLLREFEDLDYQEIADEMDITLGTVRSRLFRARAELKRRLSPYVDGGRSSLCV